MYIIYSNLSRHFIFCVSFQGTGHRLPDIRLPDADRKPDILRDHIQGREEAERGESRGSVLDPSLAKEHRLLRDTLQGGRKVRRRRQVQRSVFCQQAVS